MISRYTYKNAFWLDIESPTTFEQSALMEEHQLPHFFFSLKESVPYFSDDTRIFLALSEFDHEGTYARIRMMVDEKGLYTYHLHPLSNRHVFANLFSLDSALEKNKADRSPSTTLLLYFIETKIDSLAHKIEETKYVEAIYNRVDALTYIENELFFWQELLHYFQSSKHKLLPASSELAQMALAIQKLIFIIREEKLRIGNILREQTIRKLRMKVRIWRIAIVGLTILAFIVIFVILRTYYGHYAL